MNLSLLSIVPLSDVPAWAWGIGVCVGVVCIVAGRWMRKRGR